MKVLAVYQSERLASSRIRIQQLAPYLNAEGFAVTCLPYPKQNLGQFLREATSFNVVVLQKKLLNFWSAQQWRRLRVPVVFDFDDAIMFRDRLKFGSYRSWSRQRKFQRTIELATAVCCGNTYLAQHVPASKPKLIAPSPVYTDVPLRHEPSVDLADTALNAEPDAAINAITSPVVAAKGFNIGWLGSQKNFAQLLSLVPAFEALKSELDFVLTVVSDQPFPPQNFCVDNIPWSKDTEAQQVAQFDVGIMPLLDSPWTRGKCSYKLLQYMAAAVPAVASPVGHNRELIKDGENGFWADTLQDWQKTMLRLSRDPTLCRRLGENGRRTVLHQYSYPVIAQRWAEFLRYMGSTEINRVDTETS